MAFYGVRVMNLLRIPSREHSGLLYYHDDILSANELNGLSARNFISMCISLALRGLLALTQLFKSRAMLCVQAGYIRRH